MPEADRPVLIYFADPMCSWCWGFAPVAQQLRAESSGRLEFALVMGGLNAGAKAPMDEGMRTTLREHWRHVEQATGQPFDYRFFERERFVYDTEPACRAVVGVRMLAPGLELAMLTAIQAAFYAENRDVTTEVVLAEVAQEVGIAAERFVPHFRDAATKRTAATDFGIARATRVRGFPALVGAAEGAALTAITLGYRPLEDVRRLVASWQAALPGSAGGGRPPSQIQ